MSIFDLIRMLDGPPEPVERVKSIDMEANEQENAERVLHIGDPENWEKLAGEVVDLIERRVREMNADEPGADEKLVCGGCMLGFVDTILFEMLARSAVSNKDAADIFMTMAKGFSRDAIRHKEAADWYSGSMFSVEPMAAIPLPAPENS